jgi:Putative prokaryotic signal transducing protein
MVSVLSSPESEALIVKSILEASNIPALVEGSSLPGAYRFSGYDVMVPEEFESDARRIIADAQADARADAAAASEN